MTKFSDLLGKTILEVTGLEKDSAHVRFVTDDGTYEMYHDQDCCESVIIEDVDGDPSCLVGSPIVRAEENSNSESLNPDIEDDSFTWTFYRLATVKGGVAIRWLGSSNGYYSEDVTFEKKHR